MAMVMTKMAMAMTVKVCSALSRGSSARNVCWAKVHAQDKEGLAQLRIGLTSTVVRDKYRDPSPTSPNKNAGRTITIRTDTTDKSGHVLRDCRGTQ